MQAGKHSVKLFENPVSSCCTTLTKFFSAVYTKYLILSGTFPISSNWSKIKYSNKKDNENENFYYQLVVLTIMQANRPNFMVKNNISIKLSKH